jgi:uncharacterized YigZ family protein
MPHENEHPLDDSFFTLAHEVNSEITVKGSRFKAFCSSASSFDNAEGYLDTIRKSYRDATHHCYAYILRDDNGLTVRSSDDGEPSGTAGKPILTALQRHNLTNVICVVVRYFGGTKLGMGGLVRAYTNAAESALETGKTSEHYIKSRLRLSFPYTMTGGVEQFLNENGVDVLDRSFGEECVLTCSIRKTDVRRLTEKFIDRTRGKGAILPDG